MGYLSLIADEDSLLYIGCYPGDILSKNWLTNSGERNTIEECLSECRTRASIFGAMRVGIQ